MNSIWAGVWSLTGVVLGAILVMMKDRIQHRRERSRASFEYLRSLFEAWVTVVDKCVVRLRDPEPDPKLIAEMAAVQARFLISAPDEIYAKSEEITKLLTHWHVLIQHASIDWDGDFGPCSPESDETFQRFRREFNRHIEMMRNYLRSIDV